MLDMDMVVQHVSRSLQMSSASVGFSTLYAALDGDGRKLVALVVLVLCSEVSYNKPQSLGEQGSRRNRNVSYIPLDRVP